MMICMYGAASDRIHPEYIKAAERLGAEIAKREHTLIYGGGASGIMGGCSRGAVKENGKVIGVVPHFIQELEPVNLDCTTLIHTHTMSKRKDIMEGHADAFIISPGGIGTLDEFFQILTLKELGQTKEPIALYNINHYYDELILVLKHFIGKGFVRPTVINLFQAFDNPEELLDYLEEKEK